MEDFLQLNLYDKTYGFAHFIYGSINMYVCLKEVIATIRAKAEDEYGKTLMRIAQTSGIEEMGTLGDAWISLRKGIK